MKLKLNLSWTHIAFLFILALIIFSMFLFPGYLYNVKKYDQMVSSYIDKNGAEVSLPTTHFTKDSNHTVSIRGEFSTLFPTEDRPHIFYIPFYVGSLKLLANEVVIYDFSVKESPQHIMSTRNAFIEVPWAKLRELNDRSDTIRVSFQIENDRGGLAAISSIYVGQPSDFEQLQFLHYLYYEVFRLGMLGADFVLLFLLLYALITRSLGFEAVPPLIILMFFFIFGIGKFSNIISGVVLLGQVSLSFAPLVILIIFKLFTDIKSEDLERNLKREDILAVILTLLPNIVLAFGAIDIVDYNMFVSVPILLLGTLTLSFLSIVSFAKSQRLDMGLWAMASTITCYAIFYDAGFRFGFISVPVSMSTFSFPIFIIIIAISFIEITLSKKVDLVTANDIMKKALDIQDLTLKKEFRISAALQKKNASAEEKERLTAELHDGVLTYLSIINTMTENSTDVNLEKINKLSRNALNEIRVILEARPSDVHSLTIALGALRAQLVDPLLYMGVEVEWSTYALLDQGVIQPKALMEIIRIIQEAIHNAVIRGKCTFLSVVAQRYDNEFTITIVNKGGQPFSEENRKGLGILSMVSRASKIGGAVEIIPNDSGAILSLTVPSLSSKNVMRS
ncbi:sensor histidine kinase [Sulfitobacter sp.]|uniref:sensor histidine kinase n=1 Tax=Sulfitobacter sp. TaxID=1903071 RepID=UPI003F6C9E4F